jgi:hypothetical protein
MPVRIACTSGIPEPVKQTNIGKKKKKNIPDPVSGAINDVKYTAKNDKKTTQTTCIIHLIKVEIE